MAPNYATFYHRSSFPEQSRYFVELQHKNKQGMNALAFEKKYTHHTANVQQKR